MIGTTIYRFNENRRVYERDANGRAYGAPIWREHWEPEQIVAETRVSWITQYGTKVPKKGADPHLWAFSLEDIERRAFVEENRRAIADRVYRCDDPDLLKRIADILDAKEGGT